MESLVINIAAAKLAIKLTINLHKLPKLLTKSLTKHDCDPYITKGSDVPL